MDQIWLASPSPALRLWPGPGGATWRLNPAAAAWARARQLTEASWRGIAAALSEAHASGPEREGRLAEPPLRWRSLPMNTGWLVWLMPEASSADAPSAQCAEADGGGSSSQEVAAPGADAARLADVSARVAAPDRAEIERAGAARSEFLARMSHELRTPLNAVLGFAQLIEHDGTSVPVAVQLDRVAHIREAGEQLLRLIGDVLEHLKREVPPELQDVAPAAPDDAAETPAPIDRALSVLYIEDNPVNVILVEELVAMRPNTHLHCAVTGLAGVALAAVGAPDVVLVDMQLPDIDGFEVLRRLRANRALDQSAVIALSANGMGDDIAAALAAGFDDYWTKPIDFRHFLAGLDALARSR